MSTNETYNGWTSYATWRVNLELCEDYLSMQQEDVSSGCIERFDDVAQLSDNMKEWVENVITEDGARDGLAIDYAMAFLSDVNWYEIASHWTDELIEAEDEEMNETCDKCGGPVDVETRCDDGGYCYCEKCGEA